MSRGLWLLPVVICFLGCGEDPSIRRDKEKQIEQQVDDACRTILHPDTDEQVVAAWVCLQNACKAAREMQPPHSSVDRFEKQLEWKQPLVDEAQSRLNKVKRQHEREAEQKRIIAERERAEQEQKRQSELKAKQVADAKAKAEAAAPKWYTTGGKMLYGTKEGLLFGVDVQYFYSKSGHYYGYKDITIWVSVQNSSKSPQLLRPYSLQILDEQGAAYAPAVAKVLEGSDIVHCIATTLNPNMQVDFQLQYEVPKKSKFYFPILGRNGDAFVIEKQDWEEKPIPKYP